MLATQLTLLSLLLKVYKLGVSVRGCTLDRLPMRTMYSTVCKLREMLRTEWSTHLSIRICSTMTEGAGQFVLLVIYTVQQWVLYPRLQWQDMRGAYVNYSMCIMYSTKGGNRECWVLICTGCMCMCRHSNGCSIVLFHTHFNIYHWCQCLYHH